MNGFPDKGRMVRKCSQDIKQLHWLGVLRLERTEYAVVEKSMEKSKIMRLKGIGSLPDEWGLLWPWKNYGHYSSWCTHGDL
jgi:hypothetical protein